MADVYRVVGVKGSKMTPHGTPFKERGRAEAEADRMNTESKFFKWGREFKVQKASYGDWSDV